MRDSGRDKALKLRAEAKDMAGTEIIAQEKYIPNWYPEADYREAPVGTPVLDNNQVYSLIQPHDASHYPGTTPATLPALWRVKHTTDPAKAKPWVEPVSTSDMYLVGEVCLWTDNLIYRALRSTSYSPEAHAADWEVV